MNLFDFVYGLGPFSNTLQKNFVKLASTILSLFKNIPGTKYQEKLSVIKRDLIYSIPSNTLGITNSQASQVFMLPLCIAEVIASGGLSLNGYIGISFFKYIY